MQLIEPAELRAALTSGDVCAFVDAINASRRTGRPPHPPALMVGLVAVRRLSSRLTGRPLGWPEVLEAASGTAVAQVVGSGQELPELSACYRFERKHMLALDALFGPLERPIQEWTLKAIVDAMRQWKTLHSAWPTANDWNPAAIKSAPHRARAEAFYRDRGYPSLRVVQLTFGTWSAALEAAKAGATFDSPGMGRKEHWQAYSSTVEDHEAQADAAHFSWKERPAGSRSPSFTRSLDQPLGEDGATLYDVLAEQGMLTDEDAA